MLLILCVNQIGMSTNAGHFDASISKLKTSLLTSFDIPDFLLTDEEWKIAVAELNKTIGEK